jgi:hypothetical protein
MGAAAFLIGSHPEDRPNVALASSDMQATDVRESDGEWVNLAKGILRAKMTRRGITYDQLAAKPA